MSKMKIRTITVDESTLGLVRIAIEARIKKFDEAAKENKLKRQKIHEGIHIGLGQVPSPESIEKAWLENAHKLREVLKQIR